jgi:hypothetical protein
MLIPLCEHVITMISLDVIVECREDTVLSTMEGRTSFGLLSANLGMDVDETRQKCRSVVDAMWHSAWHLHGKFLVIIYCVMMALN